MFQRFSAALRPDGDHGAAGYWDDVELAAAPGYVDLMSRYAGRSFDGGMYRLHSSTSGPLGQSLAVAAFPEFAERLRVFGFDWLGRQFAIDLGRVGEDGPQVFLLDAGAGEALEIPVGFARFHNEEVVDDRDASLASTFFEEWAAANPSKVPLRFDQCVGYKIPLFLGGADSIENLEVTVFQVHWEFSGQLRRQVRGLPRGTVLDRIEPEL